MVENIEMGMGIGKPKKEDALSIKRGSVKKFKLFTNTYNSSTEAPIGNCTEAPGAPISNCKEADQDHSSQSGPSGHLDARQPRQTTPKTAYDWLKSGTKLGDAPMGRDVPEKNAKERETSQ